MTRMKSRSRRLALVWIGLAMALLPGCQSPGGIQWPWLRNQPPDASYQAARPTYAIPGTKPLYLNNYAGDDHTPMRPRRRDNSGVAPIAVDNPPGLTVNQGPWNGD